MPARRTEALGLPEGVREPAFVLGLLVGMLAFALGLAFFILGLSMGTTPPAPYFASVTQKLVLLGLSATAMIVGAAVTRASFGAVGL